MKTENRIQDTGYGIQKGKHVYPGPAISFNITHARAIFFGIIISILSVSGCSSNTKNTKPGLSDMQTEAYKIINDSLRSDNPFVRVNAIEISANTKQLNYMPNVQAMLQDRFVPVRFAAAVAIGEMQYSPAVNAVNQLLRDSDPNVIIGASYAMSRLGYPEYLNVLRETINSTGSQTIKANSALLLGKSNDKTSIKPLYNLMRAPDSSEMVSYQAAEALAMLGDESIFNTIWTMLISVYADERIIGVKAMGALGTPQAENALLSMLSDQIVEIRISAAEQLGKLKNKKGKNVVLEVMKKKLYQNQDPQSRERILTLTALAIGEIGTKDLTKFLPELMKNESPFVRLAAAKAVFTSSRRQ